MTQDHMILHELKEIRKGIEVLSTVFTTEVTALRHAVEVLVTIGSPGVFLKRGPAGELPEYEEKIEAITNPNWNAESSDTCQGTTAKGKPCRNTAKEGGFCSVHQP